MAQDYTVNTWQAWENDEGKVRDNFGNYKGTVFFDEDVRGVDGTFKAEPQKGDKKYGDIVDYKSTAGNARLKFQRAEREEARPPVYHPTAPELHLEPMGQPAPQREWADKSDTIRAQWAIGQAVVIAKGAQITTEFDSTRIEQIAKDFFSMVDRVQSSSPKAEAPTLTRSVEEEQAQREATRDAERLRQIGTEEPAESKTWVDDIVDMPPGDEPINLDDIPF